MQILQLAFFSSILCDFYNYDVEKPEFLQLFVKFTQVSNVALCVMIKIQCEVVFERF